jgi:hypothetical protein
MAWKPRQPGPGESWRTPTDTEIADILAEAETAIRARLPSIQFVTRSPFTVRKVGEIATTDGQCCVGWISAELYDANTLHWRVWCNIRTGEKRLFRERE